MANKPLQSIQFPGLPDKYTVPQMDSNFDGVSGKIPDSKKVHDEIASLREGLNSFSVPYAIGTNWQQGYIRDSTGAIGSDSKSCTSGYISSGGFAISLTVGSSYRTKVAHYNSSKEFVEIVLSSSVGNREVIVPAGDFVRVQVASDSAISPSDITDAVISLNERRYTDTNVIKTAGKPADAKEVFDFFDGLVNISLDSFSVLKGYYSVNSGNIGTDEHYARTTKLKQFSGRIVFASIGTGYKFAVRMWDENDAFVSEKASGYSTTYKAIVPDGWTIAFNFEDDEVSSLDNTDYEAIKSAFNVRMSGGGEFVGSTIVSSVDFNDLTETGTYRLPSTMSGTCENTPTDEYGRLVVFGDADDYSIVQLYVSYKNNVYTRILQYRDTDVWTKWTQIFNGVTGGIGAYLHDGNILRMAGNPEAIPVNENHLGYNDFISATWANFLPDNYTDGDSYDASTTKIINVHVSRESDWMSTPYGINEDTYTIYRYTFTPVNGYQKTVLLTAGCHGNEAEGYWGLYRLMRMIYFEGYKYPTLRNLRNNVRFIVVPSWNPWGMQHYRRYNAFESKTLQAWNWLFAEGNQIDVDGVVYDITDVGEANVIWTTLQEFADNLDYWIDFHTDPYAGRTTRSGEIDDPRGYTPPYGFYGFTRKQTTTKDRLQGVMEDFYNLLKNEHDFTESWHLQGLNPSPSGSGGFSPWMASLPFPTALIEVSTFMEDFPYASGSAGMMKMAQEFYGSCLSEFLR